MPSKYRQRPRDTARRSRWPSIEERFAGFVAKGDGESCWVWTGRLSPKRRYGLIWTRGRDLLAHRLAWEFAHGTAPPRDANVCHSCDNPRCVRPSHLFLGTQAQNIADMVNKGRQARGETNARSKLTDTVVGLIRTSASPHRVVAAMFGVSITAVADIRQRRSWRHLP